MNKAPARKLAAAGTAGTGAVAAAAAYLVVRGLPGMLYAAGICLAAFVGAIAIVASRSDEARAAVPAEAPVTDEVLELAVSRPPRWSRKSRMIRQLEAELTATSAELEDHRRALANLATQLSQETEAAERNGQELAQRIHELEAERDSLLELVAEERERFQLTLDELGGGIGRHGYELEKLERELEALIAR